MRIEDAPLQPGDAGASHGPWKALGAQTLQPKSVSGQRQVSTNHREHPNKDGVTSVQSKWGQPHWKLPEVLMGLSPL